MSLRIDFNIYAHLCLRKKYTPPTLKRVGALLLAVLSLKERADSARSAVGYSGSLSLLIVGASAAAAQRRRRHAPRRPFGGHLVPHLGLQLPRQLHEGRSVYVLGGGRRGRGWHRAGVRIRRRRRRRDCGSAAPGRAAAAAPVTTDPVTTSCGAASTASGHWRRRSPSVLAI